MPLVSKTHLPPDLVDPDATTVLGPPPMSPQASRRDHRRWKDPRLWIGVFLVLLSVAVGSKLLAAADDTVEVWRLSHDLELGMALTSDDVEVTRVHFADDDLAQKYVSADEPVPSGARAVVALPAGELLARSALADSGGAVPDELPLAVGPAGLPGELRSGDLVDVWAVTPPEAGQKPPVEVFSAVTVSTVTAADQVSLGADRLVSVALPPGAGTDVAQALAALNGATVVLVLVGDR